MTVPTVYQSSKTVKRQSKQQKSQLVYQSSQVYQDCTNSVPIVKNSQTAKNDHWQSLVDRNRLSSSAVVAAAVVVIASHSPRVQR